MKLFHLNSGPLGVNTYFLVNESTMTAVVIDGGESYKLVKKTESDFGFKIKAVFLTHAHFDHAGNAKKLQDDGAKIYISEIDSKKLNVKDSLAGNFGRNFDTFLPDHTFTDGQVLDVEGIKIKVIMTPGHTDGSATFLVDNMLFTGDTLFLGTVGRTDFPTGDTKTIINSVKKLFALEGDYAVYPGHDEFTTLSHERQYNTFALYE
ncbi:MAG: MBL fold metallo-hydrolase [Clostridiales bacterium]|nr:MBL fold metallo-hydrolase [Clostridiales bacterium]